jgi:hypothetical protein
MIHTPHRIHVQVSTLPSGMVFFPPGAAHNEPDRRDDYPARASVQPLLKRRLGVLVADRTRSGTGQWQQRADVVRMCEQHLLHVQARNRDRLRRRNLGRQLRGDEEGSGEDEKENEEEAWCSRPAEFDGTEGVSHAAFLRMAADAPFVACPHGGGIDPSPKAWETLLVGSIPIVQVNAANTLLSRSSLAP